MATQGQYQTFALIAYDAIKEQTLYVNEQIGKGCKVGDCNDKLYLAKHINDAVFNYSKGCMSVANVLETDILAMTNFIKETLLFTTDPIGQLAETTLNN